MRILAMTRISLNQGIYPIDAIAINKIQSYFCEFAIRIIRNREYSFKHVVVKKHQKDVSEI